LGVLKYKPHEFRALTPAEFMLAIDGHAMTLGTYKESKMTWNDVLELEEKVCRKQ
jgi:hypothetical protein